MGLKYRVQYPAIWINDVQLVAKPLYSGIGEGLNNPALEHLRAVGPIPKGKWKITEWLSKHPTKGPCVARLAPDGHKAHGRSGFLIHGDNSTPEPDDASLGCIIAGPTVRKLLRASGETSLEVV